MLYDIFKSLKDIVYYVMIEDYNCDECLVDVNVNNMCSKLE